MASQFAPDLILCNAKIVTVDRQFSVQEAVAVYDGKVVAVGDTASIKALAGSATKVVDLRGRCVVPGQYDNHVHTVLAGLDAGP